MCAHPALSVRTQSLVCAVWPRARAAWAVGGRDTHVGENAEPRRRSPVRGGGCGRACPCACGCAVSRRPVYPSSVSRV